jgi:hypothetical protein
MANALATSAQLLAHCEQERRVLLFRDTQAYLDATGARSAELLGYVTSRAAGTARDRVCLAAAEMFQARRAPTTPWLRRVRKACDALTDGLQGPAAADGPLGRAVCSATYPDLWQPDPVATRVMMNDRKRTEVERVALMAARLRQCTAANHVVDCGCGKGHIGEVLSHSFRIPTTNVEANDESLRSGERLYKRPNRLQPNSVQRVRGELRFQDPRGGVRLLRDSMVKHGPAVVTGLHVCGYLADATMSAAAMAGAEAILVVPCCYHRLEFREGDFAAERGRRRVRYAPRSAAGRALDLGGALSGSALYSANLSHEPPQPLFVDWAWRMALKHALMHLDTNQPGAVEASEDGRHRFLDGRGQLRVPGTLSPRDLHGHFDEAVPACALVPVSTRRTEWSNFPSFVAAWCRATGSSVAMPPQALEAYFERSEVVDHVLRVIAAKARVDLLGQVAEAALLLDRALALADAGYDVVARSMLSRHHSTRHLGIAATRRRAYLLPAPRS